MILCSAPLLAQPAKPTQQLAQPSASSAEMTVLTDKARDLYLEGQKAGARKMWGEAYANFLAAWSLKRHYQIAGNLGWVEVELGRYRDAAEHLSYYLREAPKEKVKERQSVEVLLAQARKHVGALAINVEPVGAEVFVDGVSAGKAPLPGEVFVEPGQRTIEAKLDGFTTARVIADVVPASSREVPLTLMKIDVVAEKVRGSGVTADDSSSGSKGAKRESGDSGAHRGVIIGGIAASAGMIIGGVVFAIASSVNAGDAASRRAALLEDNGGRDPCLTSPLPAGCEEFRSSLAAKGTFGNLSVWSFVLGGALGAGTAIYALTTPAKRRPTSSVRAVPVVSADAAGVVLIGRW